MEAEGTSVLLLKQAIEHARAVYNWPRVSTAKSHDHRRRVVVFGHYEDSYCIHSIACLALTMPLSRDRFVISTAIMSKS